jgi:hypothetical protein
LHIPAYLCLEAGLHASLISGACVLQPKGHRGVAEYTVGCDEGHLLFVINL